MNRAVAVISVLAAFGGTALASPIAPPRSGTFMLTHATVHVGDGRQLSDATVVLRDGFVESVTAGAVAVLPGAEVIDCSGKHVAPGFIGADTTIGLTEIGAVRATRDESEVGDLNPHVTSWAAFNPDSELLGVAMANGVLEAVVAPRAGLVAGQSAVMLLSGWTRDDMALRAPAAMNINWPSMTLDRSPSAKPPLAEQEKALAGQLEKLDDLLARARADRAARAAGAPASERAEDFRLQAMAPFLDGRLPVVVQAESVAQMRSAMAWAGRQGLKLVIAGGRDAWRIAPEIAAAGVPVVVGAVRTMPAHDADPYDAPFAQPGILVKAGVKIAFTVGDPAHLRNLPDEAAMAIPFGLDPADAMKALTLWPAEIFGVGHETGSLEHGKRGNLVVWSGPPLEITSRVERLFVRGEEIPLEDRHTRLWRKYSARPAPATVAVPAAPARVSAPGSRKR